MNRQEAGQVDASNWAKYDWQRTSPRASRIRNRESVLTATGDSPIAPYQPPSASNKKSYQNFAAQ